MNKKNIALKSLPYLKSGATDFEKIVVRSILGSCSDTHFQKDIYADSDSSILEIQHCLDNIQYRDKMDRLESAKLYGSRIKDILESMNTEMEFDEIYSKLISVSYNAMLLRYHMLIPVIKLESIYSTTCSGIIHVKTIDGDVLWSHSMLISTINGGVLSHTIKQIGIETINGKVLEVDPLIYKGSLLPYMYDLLEELYSLEKLYIQDDIIIGVIYQLVNELGASYMADEITKYEFDTIFHKRFMMDRNIRPMKVGKVSDIINRWIDKPSILVLYMIIYGAIYQTGVVIEHSDTLVSITDSIIVINKSLCSITLDIAKQLFDMVSKNFGHDNMQNMIYAQLYTILSLHRDRFGEIPSINRIDRRLKGFSSITRYISQSLYKQSIDTDQDFAKIVDTVANCADSYMETYGISIIEPLFSIVAIINKMTDMDKPVIIDFNKYDATGRVEVRGYDRGEWSTVLSFEVSNISTLNDLQSLYNKILSSIPPIY